MQYTRQMMSDVPYGVLLSGGLDSSLFLQLLLNMPEIELKVETNKKIGILRLHSFAVGLEGSLRFIGGSKAAEHIGSVHHEIHLPFRKE